MRSEHPTSDLDESTPAEAAMPHAWLAMWIALPVTAVATTLFGLGVGVAIGWNAKPSAPEAPEPTYDLADIGFQQACLPMVAEQTTRIEALNVQIDDLQRDLAAKRAEVVALETRSSTRTGRGASAGELGAAREALAQLTLQLQALQTEKQDLVAQLTRTQAQLADAEAAVVETRAAYDAQVDATHAAEDDAATNKYGRFLADAQLAICEKGGRKKLGDCRATVSTRLQQAAIQDDFYQCVRSGQATPVVAFAEGRAALPAHSAYLRPGDKILDGWYVTLCDPTLPEARLARATPSVYHPMSALSAAASYLSTVVPSAAAPTAAMLPSAFAAPTPSPTADLDDEIDAPLDVPAPPPRATTGGYQTDDLLDLSAILGPDDPAPAPAPRAPTATRPAAAFDDLDDLPERLD